MKPLVRRDGAQSIYSDKRTHHGRGQRHIHLRGPPWHRLKTQSPPLRPPQRLPPAHYAPALRLLASLFFIWGFITVINNTLLPHLKSVFELNYVQTTLIESVWFIAYFVASMPSAWLIERIGYRRSLVSGLADHGRAVPWA